MTKLLSIFTAITMSIAILSTVYTAAFNNPTETTSVETFTAEQAVESTNLSSIEITPMDEVPPCTYCGDNTCKCPYCNMPSAYIDTCHKDSSNPPCSFCGYSPYPCPQCGDFCRCPLCNALYFVSDVCYRIYTYLNCTNCGYEDNNPPPLITNLTIEIVNNDGYEAIKIVNPTNKAISTKGLYLSPIHIDVFGDTALFMWQLPSVIIQPGEFALIAGYNDDKNKTLKRCQFDYEFSGHPLSGDTYHLTDANGVVISLFETGEACQDC